MYIIKKIILIIFALALLGPNFVFAAEATDCVCGGTPPNCYHNVADQARCTALCTRSGGGTYGIGATIGDCVSWLQTPAAPPAATPSTPVPTGATSPETIKLTNPLKGDVTDVTDVPTLIGLIIKGALSIIGAVSIFVFIVGGFKWLTSAGNQEKISAGAKTMLWAVLGLVITFASYLVIGLLLKV